MKKLLFLLMLSVGVSAQTFFSTPFAHTYSIVAVDTVTGEIGAAVQSHWFSVGSIVIWAEAGVGAVATQSFVNPSFGPRGLSLLKSGMTSQQAVNSLLETDDGRDVRQLALRVQLRDQGFKRLLVGHVEQRMPISNAQLLHFLPQAVQARLLYISGYDVGPFPGKGQCHLVADAGTRAGNKDRPVAETLARHRTLPNRQRE